jgi:hypothetical protein
MPDFADLPVCQEWPPATPHRKVGTVRGDNGRWYVLVDDPLEIVAHAGDFPSQSAAWEWIKASRTPPNLSRAAAKQ